MSNNAYRCDVLMIVVTTQIGSSFFGAKNIAVPRTTKKSALKADFLNGCPPTKKSLLTGAVSCLETSSLGKARKFTQTGFDSWTNASQAFLGGQSAPHIVRPPGIEPGTLSLKGSCSTD